MAFPTPPAVTDPFPSRNIQDRDTFDAQVNDFGARYLPAREQYERDFAREADGLAAALVAGNLPDLTGHGGKGVAVAGNEASVNFFRPAVIMGSDSGAGGQNTRVVTTGLPLRPPYAEGQAVRFIPSARNSLATPTVFIDNNPSLTIIQPDGSPVYPGYIAPGYWYDFFPQNDGTCIAQMALDAPGGRQSIVKFTDTPPASFLVSGAILGDTDVSILSSSIRGSRVGNRVNLSGDIIMRNFSETFTDDGGVFVRFDLDEIGADAGGWVSVAPSGSADVAYGIATMRPFHAVNDDDWPNMTATLVIEPGGVLFIANSDFTYNPEAAVANRLVLKFTTEFEVTL